MPHSKILNDLIGSASAAKVHFDVWWALASEAMQHLLHVMYEHSEFFRASYGAHYTAFFVCFAHLFDTRRDSSSIPTYFSSIRTIADAAQLAALEVEYGKLLSRAQPLLKARHKTAAHIDAALQEKDVVEPLNITPNEMREIIYDSAEFVAKLACEPSGSIGIPRDRRLVEATLKMIRALERPVD